MTKINYPSINGLRAVSVIIVIISHLEYNFSIFKNCSDFILVRAFTFFLHDGNFGVNVFFTVSGFLIASILLEEEKLHNRISLKNFYIRRMLRIFPAYYFLLLVYFILQTFEVLSFSHNSWFTSLTFTKYVNWFNDHMTSHLWSLSIEEHFYILFPFIFLGGNNFRKKTIIILFFTMPIFRVMYHYTKLNYLTDLSFFTRLDAILIGCFCAFYKDWIIEMLSKHWKMWFYLSIIGLFSLRLLNLLAYEINIEILFVPFGVTYGTFANVFIAIIILYSVFGPKKNWHAFLNLKYISFIGMISYGIYLWQQIFIYGKFPWLSDSIPLRLLLTLLMAVLSYYVIEKPFLKLKSKFENKRSIKHSTSNIQH